MKDLKGLRTTVGIPYVIKITQTVHTVHGISEKGTKFEIYISLAHIWKQKSLLLVKIVVYSILFLQKRVKESK